MPDLPDNLGRRIADLRLKHGFTQQELAERVGVSRTALSHVEAGMSDPGERTVTLLAGVFKVEPHELVSGTNYPTAKSERLPVVTARYTEADHQLELLEAELRWLDGQVTPDRAVVEAWEIRLSALLGTLHDPRERTAVGAALARLRARRPRHWLR
jgi:transcriptional regulator with XRE-family HTH domain